jgi:hypothetical protein
MRGPTFNPIFNDFSHSTQTPRCKYDHKNAYFGEVDEFVTLATDHIVEYEVILAMLLKLHQPFLEPHNESIFNRYFLNCLFPQCILQRTIKTNWIHFEMFNRLPLGGCVFVILLQLNVSNLYFKKWGRFEMYSKSIYIYIYEQIMSIWLKNKRAWHIFWYQ